MGVCFPPVRAPRERGGSILLGVRVGDGRQVEREHVDDNSGGDEEDADPELPVLVGALPVGNSLLVRGLGAGVYVAVVAVVLVAHTLIVAHWAANKLVPSARTSPGG